MSQNALALLTTTLGLATFGAAQAAWPQRPLVLSPPTRAGHAGVAR